MNGKRIAMAAGAVALAASAVGYAGAAATPGTQERMSKARVAAVRDVSVAEADALVKGGSRIVVLDVRTPGEFAQGHIKGAVNLDFRNPDFAERLARLDPEKSYLLHCKSGARSAGALAIMKQQGFGDIAHLREGFDGWKASGKAFTR